MPGYRKRAVVLDAHLRHSLAIVRSLGRAGIEVLALSPRAWHPARVSRHCWRTELFDASAPADQAVPRLLELVDRHGVDVAIAGGLPGNEFLCANRAALEPRLAAAYNDAEAFAVLSQKGRTVELGRELGVPCPRSIVIDGPGALAQVADELTFPVVFKSTVDQGTVRYADGPDQLAAIQREFAAANPDLLQAGLCPIVQEYIRGTGHGFYGLGREGEVYAHFMHERMHEVPPSGGPSAMARAYDDPALMAEGLKFFAATRWNGPAMVEFKRAERDGRYYLIEVNPKFWGSLDLGIAAGVDFPLYLYQQLAGYDVTAVPGRYDRDRVFRWLTMDLAHSVQAHAIGRFFRDFLDRSITDDFRWSDPAPSAVMLVQGIKRFF